MKKIISLFMALALILGCSCIPNGLGKSFDIGIKSSAANEILKCKSIENGFELEWKQVVGSSNYTIYVSDFNPDKPFSISSALSYYTYDTMNDKYTIDNLTPGKRYNIVVKNNSNDTQLVAYNVIPTGNLFYRDNNGFIIGTDLNKVKYLAGYNGIGGVISIPTTVSYIANYAFCNKFEVSGVTVPKSCSGKVGESAFRNCMNMTIITFVGDIENVGEHAFDNCLDLARVTFSGNIHKLEKDKNVGGIEEKAFFNCHKLIEVNFKKDKSIVDKVDKSAFLSCISLSSINLPASTYVIGDTAFANCCALKSVTIPSGVESIGKYAFGYSYDEGTATAVLATGATKAEVSYWDKNFKYKTDKILQSKIFVTAYKGTAGEAYCTDYNVVCKSVGNGSTATTKSTTAASTNTTKLAAPTPTVVGGSKSVTIKWSKVAGADAYKIYKYNTSTKKYEVYKTVKGTSCKVTGLKSNTSYSFKVTSLDAVDGKYVAGKTSTVVTGKTDK